MKRGERGTNEVEGREKREGYMERGKEGVKRGAISKQEAHARRAASE